MPLLNLNVFRGHHTKERPTWWDTFYSSVHDNLSIKDKITQLHFLVNFTTADTIKGISVSQKFANHK